MAVSGCFVAQQHRFKSKFVNETMQKIYLNTQKNKNKNNNNYKNCQANPEELLHA